MASKCNMDYQKFCEEKLFMQNATSSDESYTPQAVYDKILEFCDYRWGDFLKDKEIIRPFYPGGDYKNEDYKNKVVIDNPPFSIRTEINRFYNNQDIPFFLFAPFNTVFISFPRDKNMQRKCSIYGSINIKFPLYLNKEIKLEDKLQPSLF